MKGSLMVIVYGDPASGQPPIVSVRVSQGHSQPTLVVPHDFDGGDLRVLRSDWTLNDSPTGTVTAIVSLVCYSCTMWPGTKISATSVSQPLVWAWNNVQEFEVFTYDAHLKMHQHHAGNGGWGRFYVNMDRATSKVPQLPSVPYIRPGVETYFASEEPDILAGGIVNAMKKWTLSNRVLHIHGTLMAGAFLFLIPGGVVAMRSGSPKSFKYHWIIQMTAATMIIGGMGVSISLQKSINTTHQIVGLIVVAVLCAQAYMGYKHHVDFVEIHRRTWISYSHIWTGRAAMIAASGNLLLGMTMRGYPRVILSVTAAFIVLELTSLSLFVWLRSKITARKRVEYQEAEQSAQTHRYFTIGDDTDEEPSDTEDESQKLRKSEGSVVSR
ncbi:integral membrane protein [Cordyceps javanica]|uniref:Integral membrane protein n=1 Tax=Cordyceps javanica TaxID=43265 RepID=A0A545VXU5_9HYPO|nr:integral membrane protein [Cordyceps javanica]TQW06516.1 integral membrane protein [Cordyceps javanica]